MSSLAAARADNFYNPPDWDPSTISRDKYQGSKGSNQYEQRGEIRFEVPWNMWCTSCDSHIGRGVRFNAKKREIGRYFSTKIWEFSMKCHLCGGIIVICTDPQNCDYKVTVGGKRRCMSYSTADLEVIDIHNEAHKERMEMDPIYRLQHEEEDKRKKMENALRLQSLHQLQEREKADYDNNCKLRRQFRAKKKRKMEMVKAAQDKGLAIELLEGTKEDEDMAKRVEFKAKNVVIPAKRRRMKLENESIFKSNKKRKLKESKRKNKGKSEGKSEGKSIRKLNRKSKGSTMTMTLRSQTKSLLKDKKESKEKKKLLLLNKMKNARKLKGKQAFAIPSFASK